MTRPVGTFAVAVAAGGLALCTTASLSGARQGSPQDQRPPVFRGAANFVYVDVYPRRNGKLVEDLRAGDFQVFEDGKLQKVETFEFIRIEPNAPDTERRDPNTKEEGDRLAADPRNRVFVVYLDIYHTTFTGAHYTRGPLLEFLGRTIGPTDLFGVLTPEVPVQQLVFGRKIDTLEGELTRYFDWAEGGQTIFPRSPIERQLETCMGVGAAANLGDLLVALHREDLLATSLESLMAHLRDLRDERKNVLLISEGWRPLPEQRALLQQASGTIPRIGPDPGGRLGIGVPKQGSMTNTSWCDAQIGRLASIDFEQRFRDLLILANRANVSFYPVDVGGLKTNLPDASMRGIPTPQQVLGMLEAGRARGDTLRTLAENTDGRAVVDSNDISGGFRNIADDLSAYYLLGYGSPSGPDGKFHRIEVKVNQPRISVAARRGYLAPIAAKPADAPSAAPAAPAPLIEELGRLARLRSDAEVFGYGVSTASGLDVVAEIASSQIERGRWRAGADVQLSVTGPGQPNVTATGRIDPGSRGTLMPVRLDTLGPGPWRVSVRITRGAELVEDRFDVLRSGGTLVGAPLCFRGTASARIALRPVADFQFRRTERLHVDWPVLKPLDQRTARVLDRRGQPLAIAATVTEREADGKPVIAVDVNLAALSESDYVIELVAGSGAEIERKLVAFRIVR